MLVTSYLDFRVKKPAYEAEYHPTELPFLDADIFSNFSKSNQFPVYPLPCCQRELVSPSYERTEQRKGVSLCAQILNKRKYSIAFSSFIDSRII